MSLYVGNLEFVEALDLGYVAKKVELVGKTIDGKLYKRYAREYERCNNSKRVDLPSGFDKQFVGTPIDSIMANYSWRRLIEYLECPWKFTAVPEFPKHYDHQIFSYILGYWKTDADTSIAGLLPCHKGEKHFTVGNFECRFLSETMKHRPLNADGTPYLTKYTGDISCVLWNGWLFLTCMDAHSFVNDFAKLHEARFNEHQILSI